MRYEDAQAACDAWVAFINYSLPVDRQIIASAPLDILYSGETIQ